MSMKKYNKAVLKDHSKVNDLEAEVNFSTDKKLKKYVKLNIGGKKATISIEDLHSLVFAIGDINQKADLLKYKTMDFTKLIKSHVVELTQSVAKGDTVTIRCETNVPLTIYKKLEKEALEKLRLHN